MGPTRKSRSVNRRYVDEISPSKEGDSSKRSYNKKRKLSDLLGPRWTMDELTRFYDSYRKHGKDWKKVCGAVKNRSSDMVEALYTMNRAYLSLPHGTASAAGLIAMMTDHYSNIAGSDSDQNSEDGEGSSRKIPKQSRGKLQLNTSKVTDEQNVSQAVPSNYGCLPLLTKKRPRGTQACPVRKRTPRFPVSFSAENNSGERRFSPTKKGLQLKSNANDDEVAHEIAIALAEASQRGGTPQNSHPLSKRAESVMSSPVRYNKKKHSLAELVNAKHLDSDMDEDLEGSTDADTGEVSRYKPKMLSIEAGKQRGRKFEGNRFEVDRNSENRLDDIKEECSGTDEYQRLGAARGKLVLEVNDDKVSRSSIQSQKKKSKKVPFKRDDNPAFDALQTLADLSLMMPTENEDDLRMQFKAEGDDHVDESVALEAPSNCLPKEKQRYARRKGYMASSSQIASGKTTKPGKGTGFDAAAGPEPNADLQNSITKTRKKQKAQLSKVQKTEAHPDVHPSSSPSVQTADAGNKLMNKSKKSTQSGSPKLKNSENSSSGDLRKEGSDSAQSAVQVPAVNEFNLLREVRSRRKMKLKKPVLNDFKFSDKDLKDQNNLTLCSVNGRTFNSKEKLSSCLSNPQLRRWCTYEWFYSAIDYPWFAKREFVEYLCHVGLGHVSKLTRAEWGVIRSSLGKPRRFSEPFLTEEKEKLNQYRDSVRKHYTDLREGVREGLPTDLARPLSVGQRVIAIHPKTRDIHDGSVLTVDHSRCCVQFDRHELGVEFVMDIDCMPSSLFENMPTLVGRQTIVDKFLDSNELKINGQMQEFIKVFSGDNLDTNDGISQLSPLATDTARPFKQAKVASAITGIQSGIVSSDNAGCQQTPYSQPLTPAQIQAKEADVQALVELTRALDKKEAVVLELGRMNDEVLEDQKDGDGSLKDYEPFKKRYAAVYMQLGEVNKHVSGAIQCLRQRNRYPGNIQHVWPRQVSTPADPGGEMSPLDHSTCQTHESESHANEIIDSSRTKARAMVYAAIQALSLLKSREDTNEKIEETIDYLNDRLPSDDSTQLEPPDQKSVSPSDMEAQIPSELISKCVATLLMIQKCTERQSPPSDMAQILDSAVASLQPRSSQNMPVYTEIQKCMGIIRNQIIARIPS